MKSYRLREREHEELLHDLLAARGIVGDDKKQKFLSPDFFRDSHDPYLLPDMGKAVERIIGAQKNNEQVCVWSDYDCDGIPGGVMLTQFLRAMGLVCGTISRTATKKGTGSTSVASTNSSLKTFRLSSR